MLHFKLIAAFCFWFLTIIDARALDSSHVVKESRKSLPPGWVLHSRVPGDYVLPVQIALKQPNLHNAEELIMKVSDPKSPYYGQHWSKEQVQSFFAPSEDTVDIVKAWIRSAGFSESKISQSPSMGWLRFRARVDQLENLLKTEYNLYEHDSGQLTVSCESYSVPQDISNSIDFITPTLHFDNQLGQKLDDPVQRRLRKMKKRNVARSAPGNFRPPGLGSPNSGSLPKSGGVISKSSFNNAARAGLRLCDKMITPNCLRALYGFGQVRKANPQNSYGIVEYAPQVYLPSDLDMFFANFSPALVGTRPILDSIDGGTLEVLNKSFDYLGESDLDFEYGIALAYPVPVTLYQAGDDVEGASFNNFLDAIDGSYCTYDGGDDPDYDAIYPDSLPGGYKGAENCGTYTPTRVISTSYGYNEFDLTPAYEMRQCHEYMKLGLMGVTVLYSSGDSGVGGNSAQCIDLATGNYTDGTYGAFNPGFPATCPYVTGVGATQIKNGSTVHMPEIAADVFLDNHTFEFSSGGGFSNVFAIPQYQKSAIAHYFRDYNPPYGADRYNNSRKVRGVPDVSANGAYYAVAVAGRFATVFGTSASSPVFGSIITILNNARLDAGKSTVGFLNPTIYAHPEVFNDITEGRNPGCGTAGFEAVPGWDPLTGLGTPNYDKLKSLYLSLP